MSVTIYHNPECGTSRNTLEMIRRSGTEPEVIEYLKNPPPRAKLVELIAEMQMKPRDLLRQKGTPYAELGLGDAKWTDDELIDFMLAHPILINRPIVVTPTGVKLCRPSPFPPPHCCRALRPATGRASCCCMARCASGRLAVSPRWKPHFCCRPSGPRPGYSTLPASPSRTTRRRHTKKSRSSANCRRGRRARCGAARNATVR